MNLKFGDLIENGWASDDNPTKRGYFVRRGINSGRVNSGPYIEVTDGRGKFWRLIPKGDHKITKIADAALSQQQGGK